MNEADPLVFVFDDDPTIRRLCCRLLEGCARVQEFPCAEEGLDRLPQADLVVTDLEMPGMGGGALLNHMRRTCPGTPVLVMTGSDEEPRPLAVHHAAFLAKPFTATEFLGAVKALLTQASAV